MSEKIKKCEACTDPFNWDDQVIVVDEDYYHKDCVTLYPIGYVAFIDGNCLGETENEDGEDVFEVLEVGEYLEEDDE